jgi:hypothetical protein
LSSCSLQLRWVGPVPCLPEVRRHADCSIKCRRHVIDGRRRQTRQRAVESAPHAPVSAFRLALLRSTAVLQQAPRLSERRPVSRIPAVRLWTDAGHQLFAESAAFRLECARLATRSGGDAHLPPVAIPDIALQARRRRPVPTVSAAAGLRATERRTVHTRRTALLHAAAPTRSRAAAADPAATVQSSPPDAGLRVRSDRDPSTGRTHRLQVLVSRYKCLALYRSPRPPHE